MDYYFAKPISGIDQNYSDLRGAYASKLPIVRIFGTSPTGQKICANIHGVLPYFYVLCPPSSDGFVGDYLRNFCSELERALCSATKSSIIGEMVVFSATVVSGRSIYGFSDQESLFIKVHMLDPSIFPQCAEILLSGMVMGRSFQPFETHIPFLLKFCIDYNLYGMNYLHTEHFKIRAYSSERCNTNEDHIDTIENTWHLGRVPSSQLLPPDIAPIQTSTELEVDISAHDILNRVEHDGASLDSNPGLEALWLEERFRRGNRLIHSPSTSFPPVPELPTPDELLPLTTQNVIPPSPSEVKWLAHWEQLCRQLRLKAVDNALQTINQPSDSVSDWLGSSPPGVDEDSNQTKEVSAAEGSIPSPILDSASQCKHSQSSGTGSDVSLQTRISSVSYQELLRLALATEEADAPVFQLNQPANLDWSLFQTNSARNSPNRTAVSHIHIGPASQIQSSSTASTNHSILAASQSDLLTSQLDSTRSSLVALMTDSSRVTEVEDIDDDDAEATLVSSATRAAIAYMSRSLSQRDLGGGYTSPLVGGVDDDVRDMVDLEDNVTMSEVIHSDDEDEESAMPDVYLDRFDEPLDEAHYSSHELITPRTQPSMGRLASLDELDEHSVLSDESIGSDFECHVTAARQNSSNQNPTGSSWSAHPENDTSSQLLQAEHSQSSGDLNDDHSALLLTGWSSNTDDSDQYIHSIPQVDGPGDDEKSDISGVSLEASTRTRRRRLGLRLTSRSTRLSKQSRIEDPAVSDKQSFVSQTASRPIDLPDGEREQAPTTSVDSSRPAGLNAEWMGSMSCSGPQSSCIRDPSIDISCAKGLSCVSDQISLNPTVVLERLDDRNLQGQLVSTTFPHSTDSFLLAPVTRPSPPEEFEDITALDSGCDGLPRCADHDLSSFSLLSDNSHSFPGRLTLFSQTQYSPQSVSPLPIQPLQSGIWTQSLPEWKCSRVPPSFASVLHWTRTSDNPLTAGPHTPTSVTLGNQSKSEDSSGVEENPFPDKPLSDQPFDIGEPLDQSLNKEPMSDVSGHETVSHRTPSSVSSVSMLYQAASQRCFLPVQVDHTTVASLELHCRVRTASDRRLSSIDSKSTGGIRRSRGKSSPYGLLPDPAFDPVCLACLSLCRPNKLTDLFVLINRSELRGEGCSSDQVTVANVSADSRRRRVGFLTNWLTGDQDALGPYPPEHRSSGRGRTRPQPKWIWCRDEWDLYNWIVYLVQKFDPELLVGYDVERASWGYLVERATSHLQRQSYARELSRLAPDVVQCPHCSLLINKCGRLVPASHTHTEDVSINLSGPGGCCSCPCCTRPGASEHPLSRRPQAWPAGPGSGRTGGPFPCPGRVVLCLWRVLMSEVSLFEYSLETVVRRLLHETVPRFSVAQLHQWFTDPSRSERWRTIDYWIYRSLVNLRLISIVDLVGRTSEFARVFGIEFYHVLSRGSQFRVESLLGRTARSANFLLPSPSVSQRARQRAPEAIPLTLEPESRLFVDGPVAVLDFQSLYPSIIIAYNYCYSTVLGRIECLSRGEENVFELGCLSQLIPSGLIDSLDSNVTISPNGVVFVNSSIREGILPRMLKQLLRTRLMVKDSMKLYKSDKCLTRLLDARQLGLKLMANVIYGYTAASFSGRMPCVDVGDSIVHKARETLEHAIHMVHAGSIPMPDGVHLLTPPRVVYGDTDSLFVHLPGLGRKEAFAVGEAIAKAVTAANPAPIKLKLEKIYYPCLLEAKKRYAGYAYETPTQAEPVFDTKGLETVRRDGCPFVSQMLEATLRMLFDQFTLPMSISSDLSTNSAVSDATHRDQLLQMAESRVRELVQMYAHRLLRGQIPFADCILTRPYWGQASYRPGAFAPALQVARRLIAMDPRSEPAVGERVAYYLAPGRPDETLISCIRTLSELSAPTSAAHGRRALSPRLNLAYYLNKQLIPPLIRMGQLMGWRVDSWLQGLPRFHAIGTNRYAVVRLTPGASNQPSLNRLDSMDSPSSSFSQSSSLLSRQCISSFDGPSDPPNRNRRRRRRPSSIMRAFLRKAPRHCAICDVVCSPVNPLNQFGYCQQCVSRNARLSVIGPVQFGADLNRISQDLHRTELICTGCLGHRGRQYDAVWLCQNILCPMHSARLQATSRLAVFFGSRNATDLDSTLSW